ncbi:MAG: arylsulfatase [Pirellulales bacterium]|nr:arylsulfatase [Pirellulales bacterium]
MNAYQFLAALCLLTASTSSVSAAESKRPNIVYFLVDDLGREDCGFMGGKEIRTPHIDKLAAAGAKLDAYYVQPLCSPTRAALLTGRYPMRHGLQVGVVKPWARYGLPLDERTLADDLQVAGYATGVFGKWHLGHFAPQYLPLQRGFTRQYGHYNGALDYFTHERDGGFDWHEDDKVCRDKGYSTTLIGEKAAQFVSDNAGKKPFFLYVPFTAVHSPYQPPKGGVDAYPNLKGQRRNYAAMLTATDEAVGSVVAAVEKAGLSDDTLFIFSSDNGGPDPGRITDNGHYRGGKGGLYEGGVRVAACATWSGRIPAGSTVTEPMHVVDWRPTLQKLCGGAATGELPMDGLDVWPTLTAGAPSPHDVILLNTSPEVGAVRAGDWKLIVKHHAPRGRRKADRRRGEPAVELFDLRNDPREATNLAHTHPEKVKELRQRLATFAEEAVPPKATPAPKTFEVPAVWGEAG